MAQQVPKTRSTNELNQRLIKMKEEKSRLQQAGQMSLGNYNYKQISEKIPVQAIGKIGEKYFEQEIKPKKFDINEAQNAQKALQMLKKKSKSSAKYRKENINNNSSNQIENEQNEQSQEQIFDQAINELFDLPNPHFRKLFDPDVFYKINESDDEDALEKQQREQLLAKVELTDQQKQQKKSLLQKLNQNLQQKQLEEQEKLKQDSYNQNLESIAKKNRRSFSARKRPLKSNMKEKDKLQQSFEEDGKKKKQIQFQNEDLNEEQQTIKNLANKNIPKWKKRSEAFRAALRAGKGQQITDKENQIIVDSLNKDDLIQCEFCKRKFNDKAAEKHIPFCKDKQLTEKMKNPRKKKLQYENPLK